MVTMMSSYLYRLDFENGKSYIGVSTLSAEARFKSHAKAEKQGRALLIYHAWRKYGAPKLVVLAIVEDYDLFETEKRAIAVYNTKKPNGYNLTDGGEGPTGYEFTDEAKAKISESSKGNKCSLGYKWFNDGVIEITRKECPDGFVAGMLPGRKSSAETKAKISESLKGNQRAKGNTSLRGKPKSEEHKAKMSAAQKGKTHSDEARAKMSAARRGKPKSESWKLARVGMMFYNNGIITIRSKERPEGFLPGRLKKQI